MYLSTIKVLQTIKKLWRTQDFGIEIHSGEITRRRLKQVLSFLHTVLLLDLIYMIMFLPIIVELSQTVWELWPAEDFGFRGNK